MGNWVLENQPDTYWQVRDAPNQTNGGPTFRVTPQGAVTALRWWRDGEFRDTPTVIALFRVADQSLIASVSPVIDNFQVGWQVSPLQTPAHVEGGTDYLVAAFFPPSGGLGSNTASLNAPPDGIQITSQVRHYHDGAPFQFPDNTILNYRQALDAFVEFGDAPYPQYGGINTGDLYNELYKWLHPSGSAYGGSALQLLGDAVATNGGMLDTMLNRWSEALATKLNQSSDDTAALLNRWSEGLANKLDTTGNEVIQWASDVAACFSGSTIGALLCALIATVKALRRPTIGAENDWVLEDEVPFSDSLEWHQPGDAFRVHLSAFDPAGTSEPFGTQVRYGYLGKYSALNETYAREWHYFNTPDADLIFPERVPGLALILYRPGTGSVQAWSYEGN